MVLLLLVPLVVVAFARIRKKIEYVLSKYRKPTIANGGGGGGRPGRPGGIGRPPIAP